MSKFKISRREFLQAAASASFLTAIGSHSLLAQPNPQNRLISTNEWESDNIFLQGINAPVFKEVDINTLKVTGKIPSDLNGIYLRNGPNPFLKPESYQYPLQGDGMIHAVYFEEGKARYRNRWIQTKTFREDLEGKEKSDLPLINYANTNIVPVGDTLLALYEVGLPYQLTTELETVGEWDFQGKLEQSMTAHPKVDPLTGELHFYRYSLLASPYLVYYVADKNGKIVREIPVDLPQPALLHDTAISENYIIFFHCPLVFDVFKALDGQSPFKWQPDQSTRVGLIHRKDVNQKPIWLETEPMWMWHFMNAYEEGDQLKVDFAYHHEVKLDNTLDSMLDVQANFHRMVINLKDKTVKHEALDDRVVDFPTLDARKTGQPYRFGYTPHIDVELILHKKIPNYFPELIQYDLVNNSSKVHRFKPGQYCGEATFVPQEGHDSESDGYVMTFVFDETTGNSNLVILDPANFEQEPIAEIHLPVRVPTGFHANWVPKTV